MVGIRDEERVIFWSRGKERVGFTVMGVGGRGIGVVGRGVVVEDQSFDSLLFGLFDFALGAVRDGEAGIGGEVDVARLEWSVSTYYRVPFRLWGST